MSEQAQALAHGRYRLAIECDLKFEGALHIGTGQRLSPATDSPVLRGGNNEPYLPGSSVRGVLRDWCKREAPLLGVSRAAVIRLFGATPRTGGESDDRQGRLTVLDTKLSGGSLEVRDHVRLDPGTGAAAEGGKFDQEIILRPKGTLKLLYEGDRSGDEEIALLEAGLAALSQGVLAFGARSGSGLGRVAVAGDIRRTALDRGETADLSTYLSARVQGQEAVGAAAKPTRPGARRKREPDELELKSWSWLRLPLRLQFEGPMLVAGPGRIAAGEPAEATYFVERTGATILPGSSLRGALRAHAIRIASSVGLEEAASTLFGSVNRQGLVRIGDGTLANAQDGAPPTVRLDHVAVDRISGFAAEGKLFDTLALASPAFHVDVVARWYADDAEHRRALALLLFVLRDAQKGLLWVGSRTTRGYGHLKAVALREEDEPRKQGCLSIVEVDAEGIESRQEHRLSAGSISQLAGVQSVGAALAEWSAALPIEAKRA